MPKNARRPVALQKLANAYAAAARTISLAAGGPGVIVLTPIPKGKPE